MNTIIGAGLILAAGLAAGCGHYGRRDGAHRWNHLERKLSLTAEQKPLWDEFRRESLLAQQELEAAKDRACEAFAGSLISEPFDQEKFLGLLDQSLAGSRQSAARLAGAWGRVHATLTQQQKSRLRELASTWEAGRKRGRTRGR